MMKRALVCLTLILVLAPPISAGNAPEKDKGSFWHALKAKLQRVAPDKRTAATTAAGGIREAKLNSSDVLYWKGREETIMVAEDELASFNDALQLVLDGKRAEAVKRFEDFLDTYSKSPLAEDARSAISELKKEGP